MIKDNKLSICFAICIIIAITMMIPLTLLGLKLINEFLGVIILAILMVLFAADMIWMVMILKDDK